MTLADLTGSAPERDDRTAGGLALEPSGVAAVTTTRGAGWQVDPELSWKVRGPRAMRSSGLGTHGHRRRNGSDFRRPITVSGIILYKTDLSTRL